MLAGEGEDLLERLPVLGDGLVEELCAVADLAEDRMREQPLAVRGDGIRRQRTEALELVGRKIEGRLVSVHRIFWVEAVPSPGPFGRITPQP